MLGIGLGAFVQGMEAGIGIRDRIDDGKLRRAERQRILDNRAALDKIDTDTRQGFDQAVEQGAAPEEQFEEFWTRYALPKRTNELLRQGRIDEARALKDWGESDAARQGGKLFSSALLKAQTGDNEGALQDVIAAGKVKGYIEHGYELTGQQPIVDDSGRTVGYRLTVRDGDGEPVEQDIALGDIPRLISTFANPDAAWASQAEQRQKAADADDKQQRDLDTHEKKKQIDQRYKGDDHAATYRKAREERMKNDLNFADLSPEEQDKAVRADLDAAESYARTRAGTPEGDGIGLAPKPGGKVVLDRKTGRPAEQPRDPGPAGLRPEPTSAAVPTAPGKRAHSREDIIRDAAEHIRAGGNPDYIAQRLLNAGIAETEWPQELRGVMGR